MVRMYVVLKTAAWCLSRLVLSIITNYTEVETLNGSFIINSVIHSFKCYTSLASLPKLNKCILDIRVWMIKIN